MSLKVDPILKNRSKQESVQVNISLSSENYEEDFFSSRGGGIRTNTVHCLILWHPLINGNSIFSFSLDLLVIISPIFFP